jgi:hypothetical protein
VTGGRRRIIGDASALPSAKCKIFDSKLEGEIGLR